MFVKKTSSKKVKRNYFVLIAAIVLIINPVTSDSLDISSNGSSAGETEILEKAVELRQEKTKSDEIFTYSSAALVLFMFVNLGTVLDLLRLKTILRRPIGPIVGFCGRYFVMPAVAIGLGLTLLREEHELQVALFLTALAPSGGIANICIIFLKGNLNLSLTVTTFNSLLALAMFPFWILFLAPLIFDHTNVEFAVPFVNLVVTSVALIVAMGIGVALRMCIPKTTRFIFRLLKPVSVILSLALIGLSVGMNAFAFKDVTIPIACIAVILPCLGYLLSYGLSKILCRSDTDSMTISIETSVINMTVPILLLKYSLDAAAVDEALVIPIMLSLVSLFLIICFYAARRFLGFNKKIDDDCFDEKQLLDEGQP